MNVMNAYQELICGMLMLKIYLANSNVLKDILVILLHNSVKFVKVVLQVIVLIVTELHKCVPNV